jgi:sulfite reductase alpha subunit-like flavoprotein
VDLLVAIVNYRTLLKAPRRGVCTSWLSRVPLGVHFPPSRIGAMED